MKILSVLIISILMLNAFSVVAQIDKPTIDTAKRTLYLIKKTDKAEFYGYIISDDGREILVETKNVGRIYIAKSDIAEIVQVADDSESTPGDKYSDYRSAGAFTTRYYFTTNALPIKKKENYTMLHLFGPEVHFAVTDNLSLGIMSSWIGSPIAVASKYSFNSKNKTHFAIGTILASSGYFGNAKGYGGMHWATVTQGDRVSNVSLSAGYAYAGYSGAEFSNGSKYSYNNYYSTGIDKYEIPYQAVSALELKLFGPNPKDSDMEFIKKGPQGSVIVGVSGITAVGKKASFIFDSMTFFGKSKKVEYTDEKITVTYDDMGTSKTETFTIGKGSLVNNGTRTTIILMPGMRFNQSHSKAFQVVLAGVILIDKDEVLSFPVPMISWLRQF